MLITAAIKVHIDKTNKDICIQCRRHYEAFELLKDFGFNPSEGYKVLDQGFMDQHGNFLNRREAWKHAAECGQLSEQQIRDTEFSEELFSEDLW